MNHLSIEELTQLIPFLEDIFTAKNYYMVSKNTQKSFDLHEKNVGYLLTVQIPEEIKVQLNEENEEEVIEKRFGQELSLFKNRKITLLTKTTTQLLPTIMTPIILPPVTSKIINFFIKNNMIKPIQRVTIKYTLTCVEDRSQIISLDPFKEFDYLHLIIYDIYRVELHKVISKQLKIKTLVITFKMAADIEPTIFNSFNEFHIDKMIIICKRKEEIDKLNLIKSIKANPNIQICCRFWYKAIDPKMVIVWKPNLLYMTEDGVLEADILTKYSPWNIKFVELPPDENEDSFQN
ncbi:hypothetical protein EDI_096990 [Entamoeba dispar SAW760]|uniref:Uncharacterized protein n=1 Tax=Entamoeba dispar (strain ATCC PRA-260 / SAW760) TaxID=370354 RepID=B0EBC5_ENTDS|nr:uncharacterized protein EDI_096990 [Entamoeba dispar SAW760]EDR28176.1 hypothetical protein EDI_096990 [Entamoeba dispar SAW760]|eukprot:EDR28176.1 hypothetical protein EDI_096990 [Entamoeba dispar SAW760]